MEKTIPPEKECRKCGLTKPSAEFSRHRQKRDGLNSWCKKCAIKLSEEWVIKNADYCRKRDKERRKQLTPEERESKRTYLRCWTYGIPVTALEPLMALFDRRCAMCGSDRRLAIDHDHKTSRVRAILCQRCNTGIGYLENVEWMERAHLFLNGKLPGMDQVAKIIAEAPKPEPKKRRPRRRYDV